MKVLVVGPGGREHAIVRALLRDEAVETVEAAPGNAGIAQDVTCHSLDANDGGAVASLAAERGYDLVVIGPEAPLAAGVADAVREVGIPVFGPSAQAARLEASKAFAKEIMEAAEVPTAGSVHATALPEAEAALDRFGAPHVVKDDGLAAGKGVVVTEDRAEAVEHARACFEAGGSVVIEEFLDGPEVSLFVLSDGTDLVPLSPAQDFKRIFDGGLGPNTGGMGAYTPLDWLEGYTETVSDMARTDAEASARVPDVRGPEAGTTLDFTGIVMERVARPTVAEMARRGTPFVGVLYCGLAVTSRGVRVVEFNARFGDPETQAVLERLSTPLGQLLLDCATGSLGERLQREGPELQWRDGYAADVVMAAQNYPDSPRKGDVISGLEAAAARENTAVLHAGTAADDAGNILTAGGRVLAVVGTGSTLAEAVQRAYTGAGEISWEGEQHRSDIAAEALAGQIKVAPQLPGWVHVSSGKVRELYVPAAGSEWDGQEVMLMVATDRISAYDYALSPGIPGKGTILTQLSLWWFQQLETAGVAGHVVSTEVPAAVAGRALIVRRLRMIEAEAIVRGYLTGSGYAEYRESGTVTGIPLPEGLRDGSRLPEPLFTPSTKAEQGGHDENISFAQLEQTIGSEQAAALRDAALKVYALAEETARNAGIILADTKFEFGLDAEGRLVLADEALTPDSSRFWPAETWEQHVQQGKPQPSFDKQYVRNWLTSPDSGWDRGAGVVPPALPQDVVEATRERYLDAYRRLTGQHLEL